MAPVRSIPLRSSGLRTVPLGTQSVSFRNGVPVSARAGANPLLNGGVGPGQGTNPLSVVNAVLSWANEPASAVAYALRGDPANVGRSLLNFSVPVTKFVDRLESPDAHVSDTPVIRRAINRLPAPFRFPVAFGVDLFTDPTTYLTFGTSGVVKGAAREGAESVTRSAALSLTERGLRAAQDEVARQAARKAAGRGIRVNLAVPFTRNRTLPLFTVPTGGVARAAGHVGKRLPERARVDVPEALRSSLLPTRGANPVTNAAAQAIRRGANVDTAAYTRAADELQRDIFRRARELGEKPAALARRITLHLDDPSRFPTIDGASDLAARARNLLDEIGARELDDGLERGSVSNYVPHMLKDRRELARFNREFPRSDAQKAAQQANPFFVHERAGTNTRISDIESSGFRVEDNIAELIRARAAASARARIGRATENVIVRQSDGVRPPLAAVPDLEEVGARVARAEAAAATGGKKAQKELRKARKAEGKAAAKAERIIAENEAILARPGRVVDADEVARRAEQGWQQLDSGHSYLNGVLLSPEARRELARVHKWIADSMKDPNAALRFMSRIMTMWKRLALGTPGFHARNMMGDGLRSWWAGARDPRSYAQAARALRGHGQVTVRGKVYSADELVNLAREHGALDIGMVASDVRPGEALTRRYAAMHYGRGRYINWLRTSENIGDARENWTRLSLFLERLKAGDTPAQAARVTRTWLFDYGEVGAFLDVARRYWTPFIVYTAKSTPLVARAFLERPARASHIYSLMNVAQQEAGNPDLSQVPEDMRQAIPMPPWMSSVVGRILNAQPTATGERPTLLVNPRGILDYPNLGLADPRLARRNLSDLLGPQIKAPIEQLTGYSFYRGGMFPERVRAGATAELLGRIPGAQSTGLFGTKRDSYTGEQVPAINSRLDALLRLAPPYSQIGSLLSPLVPGQSDTPNLGAARTLAGLPVTPYDRAKQAYFAAKFGRQ